MLEETCLTEDQHDLVATMCVAKALLARRVLHARD